MTGDARNAPSSRRASASSEEVSVGGDPSPLLGAVSGLGKVVGAVALLIVATAVVAAVVALLY